MPYLTWRTVEGQNNVPGQRLLCDGCGRRRDELILMQSKGVKPEKGFSLCVECLDDVNQTVNWNNGLPNRLVS